MEPVTNAKHQVKHEPSVHHHEVETVTIPTLQVKNDMQTGPFLVPNPHSLKVTELTFKAKSVATEHKITVFLREVRVCLQEGGALPVRPWLPLPPVLHKR